jgi:hypothetical protein
MGLQDIIGDWQFTERSVILPAGGNTVQLMQANPRRYAFMVGVVAASLPNDVLTLSTQPPGLVPSSVGIPVRINEPLFLDLQHHGIMVSQNWYIGSIAGNGYTVTVMEVIQSSVIGAAHG